MTGALLVTIGPPGAGKSHWRKGFLAANPKATVVNLDTNRAAVSCCSANQATTALAVELGVSTTRTVLARGGTLVWDATSADAADRALLRVLAAEYGARTTAVVLLPELETVLARNAARSTRRCPCCGYARQVPGIVVTTMHATISSDVPRLASEGWHEVRLALDQAEHELRAWEDVDTLLRARTW